MCNSPKKQAAFFEISISKRNTFPRDKTPQHITLVVSVLYTHVIRVASLKFPNTVLSKTYWNDYFASVYTLVIRVACSKMGNVISHPPPKKNYYLSLKETLSREILSYPLKKLLLRNKHGDVIWTYNLLYIF